MNNESIYMNISEYPLKNRNIVFVLPINTQVEINGKIGLAKNIKIGNIVKFPYNKSEYTITVNDLEFTNINAASSCFTGDCKIHSSRGLIPVNELKIGDKILNSTGDFSEIKCILVNEINENEIIDMYVCKGLTITAYHPVKNNSKWVFPIDCETFIKNNIKVELLYSIGLIGATSFLIDGIEVIGLGHGITNDIVAIHEYFGTEKVINDIFSLSPNGYCKIISSQITRNSITGLVDGIKDIKDIFL